MTVGSPTWCPAPLPDEAVQGIRAAFRASLGEEPDGVWAAPGRVNVIGEHLDYNGGQCLAFALPHRTLVALRRRDDSVVSLRSVQAPAADLSSWRGTLDDIRPGVVTGWLGYAVGVPWALRADGFDIPGFDALVDGYVPLGSGLSSSAALTCAIAVAIDGAAGLGLAATDAGRARLARACMAAENLMALAPTGGMDQTASLRSSAGHAVLIDFPTFAVEQVPFDLAGAGLALLVTDTRAHHAHALGAYGNRRAECEEAARRLGVAYLADVELAGLDAALAGIGPDPGGALGRRTRHVVTESARVDEVMTLLAAADLRAIGAVLDASHRSLRDDFEVSCEELDLACSAAADAGALGSRMIGGGFGGSAIHLVDEHRVEAVAAVLRQSFLDARLVEPVFLRAQPAAPADQLWSVPAG